MTRRLLSGFLIVFCLLLSGCSGSSLLGKDPRCPFTERGGCHSVKTINRMIDENQFTSDGNFVAQKPKQPLSRLKKKTMQVYFPKLDKFGRSITGQVPDYNAISVG